MAPSNFNNRQNLNIPYCNSSRHSIRNKLFLLQDNKGPNWHTKRTNKGSRTLRYWMKLKTKASRVWNGGNEVSCVGLTNSTQITIWRTQEQVQIHWSALPWQHFGSEQSGAYITKRDYIYNAKTALTSALLFQYNQYCCVPFKCCVQCLQMQLFSCEIKNNYLN